MKNAEGMIITTVRSTASVEMERDLLMAFRGFLPFRNITDEIHKRCPRLARRERDAGCLVYVADTYECITEIEHRLRILLEREHRRERIVIHTCEVFCDLAHTRHGIY